MPPGGGGTRPADAGPATCSCSGGHPQAPAGSVADTSRPVHQPSAHRPSGHRPRSGSSSGQPRRPQCPVMQPPRHRPQGPAAAGWRRTRSRRCGARAGPRRSDLLVCAGHVVRSTQPAENGCPNAWTPDAACRTPGAGTPRHCGHPRPPQGTGTLRQRPRWIAGSRTVHHPATVSDRNGTPMCGTGHHARLTARSVAWCSASIWSGPDGSGLITLSASSIWSAPDGSRRIVWMIKRMIKCLRQRIVDKASNRVEPPDLESDVLSTG
jgi:hypothetical protein